VSNVNHEQGLAMRNYLKTAFAATVAAACLASFGAHAQQTQSTLPSGTPAPAKKAERRGPLGGFSTNSKEPIQIEAKQLDVLDKDGKAIYSGDVVAVQGKSTLRCSRLVIFYEQSDGAGKGAEKPVKAAANSNGGKSIKRLECSGPVSMVSETQTATGDFGVYEAATEIVTLTGKEVVLADGPNIQNGTKLVYNSQTGVAVVTGEGRVGGIFIPGSDAAKKNDPASKGAGGKAKPVAQ
jgi:lipopolysaccharide export system protein LptA